MSDFQSRLYGDASPASPASPRLVVQRDAVPAAAPADDAATRAELIAATAEPELYQAFRARPHPVIGLTLIERNGTMHGFQYHTIRHPKHQRGQSGELLSFTADGLAVVMEGHGLAVLFVALMRHVLMQVREYDGRQRIEDDSVRVTRLEVAGPPAPPAPRAQAG